MTYLIAFDGSDDARAAIAYTGARLRPEPTVVLTVWEPLLSQLAWAPLAAGGPVPVQQHDEQWEEERQAERVAQEGAELAAAAGLPGARPVAGRGTGPVWSTIVDHAAELDAALIVVGSRGLSRVKSVLLGSVSDRVLHHAGRPTLIVPPADRTG
ncbi:universal stress protein [Actinomadura sp. 21ATH]|uniref:universal stress protein n=1 Tax=Actinomadura sp. 21ATH TaxID=1735444 RepID=UPI0035C176FF